MAEREPDSARGETTERPSEYWFVELWYENRQLFKELVKHIVFFGFFFGIIVGASYIIEQAHLPEDEKALIHRLHFAPYLVAFAICAGSFIIKVFRYEAWGIQR